MDITETKIIAHIRKMWRPISCVAIALSLIVHGIIIPIVTVIQGEYATDLTGLAALITSVAAAFAVREWGKIKGNE